jgi:hypothetical protein
MKKKINFGKIAYNNPKIKNNLVTLDIELNYNKSDKPCFTASASVWNSKGTDIVTGGQCLDSLLPYFKNNKLFNQIYRLWELYHLNDLNAGTQEQAQLVNNWLKDTGQRYDYSQVCEYLKSVGKYEVEHEGKPYKYEHAWIYYPIPVGDLTLIKELFN